MEWEFSETEDGGGAFLATGKVVGAIRTHLARGELENALSLYESCVENVGDELMAEFRAASTKLKKAMANLFYRARDYKRAATACMQLGEWGAAARSFEASFDYARAAECYLKVRDAPRAAAMWAKAGNPQKAAEVYHRVGDFGKAAQVMASAGDHLQAAQLAVRAGDRENAARYLAQVPPNDPHFSRAVLLLADLLLKLGRADVAVQRLTAALPADGVVRDAKYAEIAYQLGVVLESLSRHPEAQRPFGMVRAFDPDYKDVSSKLADATARASTSSQGRSAPDRAATLASTAPVVTGIADEPMPSVSLPEANDQFAALDGNVFGRRNRNVTAPEIPAFGNDIDVPRAHSAQFVTRMEDYSLLKSLPIFEEMSLDEMKDFYHLCEHILFDPNEVIIQQGEAGQGLFIIREGSVQVTKVDNGRDIPIATLGAGNYVGEMSLVDGGPSSARVSAGPEQVKVFKISNDAFETYLYGHDLVAMRVYRTFTKTLVSRLREANERVGS